MIDHNKIKAAIDNYFTNTPTVKIIENLDRHAIDRKKYLNRENIDHPPINNKGSISDKLVRFEEVTPANTGAAFLDASLESLVTPLGLPLYEGYDDLDEMRLTFLTLPSGETVTLMEYLHSPQPGVYICVDGKMQNIPQIVFDSCLHLQVSREEVIWFHPDWQEEIDRLYAEHGSIWQSQRYANEKRPESSQVEELGIEYEPIDCFNHALGIYTREYVPATYWAMLQRNLGLAYFNRIKGNRRKNLERSIECFDRSLEIFTQNEFPEKWKINQDDLNQSQLSLELILRRTEEDIIQLVKLRESNMSRLERLSSDLNNFIARLFKPKSFLVKDIIDRPIRWRQLEKVDLSGADMSDAILSNANLSGANLSGANLSGADLSGAGLFYTNLIRANLITANLSLAHLNGADLTLANLSGADLKSASLWDADLSGADLSSADLRIADLSGANLSGADVNNTRFWLNSGISKSMKQNLIERGAIFEDSVGDRSESKNLVPR
jgi:uncharacterized protein YjbI with pentapeptide repeats